MPGSRKLGRVTAHRKSMLRGLVTYLIEHGQIETTVTRAKEVRPLAEKMITAAKRVHTFESEHDKLHARRQVFSFITKEEVAHKLIDDIAPQYDDRDGGYTRIIRTGPRRGDGAEMAIIELV